MIIYEELRWGNVFSYGPTNKIRLDQSPLTQLVGKNGHGKSSIALILEEVQFNTNSKGIKKSNVINRYTKEKNYWIELDFNKDGNSYRIRTVRTASSGTVVLTCNGDDISSHTATGTYKSIENILGYDHKTFSQIVYQGSVSSLEFLTATDTARKKFLIELLNLTHYTRGSDVFKKISSDKTKAFDIAAAKVATVTSWINKYKDEDLNKQPLVIEPEPATSEVADLSSLETSLTNIETTNKKIIQNNKYKELLDAVQVIAWKAQIPDRNDFYYTASVELAAAQKELKDGKGLKATGPTTKCVTCSQDIDNSTMFNMSKLFESKRPELEAKVLELQGRLKLFELDEAAYTKYQKSYTEYEKYHALYDSTMTSVLLDAAEIERSITALKLTIKTVNAAITAAKRLNKDAAERNAKIDVISAQMADMQKELQVYTAEVAKLTDDLGDLDILVKAFSTTGLVAYKIECMVKDLEDATNEYLGTLADGRFQISFQITSSDKLNVVITDNGRDIDISALSTGERARVNVASLLAIRKLMQSLSNSRSNLLILDETISNLDAYGKEKLVEVLLAEVSLNTFIVSHDFTHPLLEKLEIIKDNHISRIEIS